ncbi:MAG: Crp/Fnr family transcriptional regulator [Actinomycetota bacterium]
MPEPIPTAETLARLREVPFFARLPAAALEQIHSQGVVRRYARGEALFARGEAPKGLFVVLRGGVRVYQVGDTGKEHVLTLEQPGSSVAELPLFDGGAYPAWGAAAEDSVLFMLPCDRFDRLLRESPELAREVIQTLAGRLRKLVQMVESIALKEVRQRVAGLLVMLADQHGLEFTLPASNEQIAAQLGTAREVVSRAMHSFAHDGLLDLDGRAVTVLDLEGLRQRA